MHFKTYINNHERIFIAITSKNNIPSVHEQESITQDWEYGSGQLLPEQPGGGVPGDGGPG